MNCSECDHEDYAEESVKQLAECPSDCHRETHLF